MNPINELDFSGDEDIGSFDQNDEEDIHHVAN